MPAGFHLLMAAQFLSALADNALLIVAVALLQEQGLAAWWAPMLKFSLTIAYVLLAPLVGPLADAFVKARVMMAMNALKVVGVGWLLAGGSPLVAFAILGVGAAAYAPAKYGLVNELVPPQRLVAANGWIEVSTVCAVLLGFMLGGLLVGPLAPPLMTGAAALLSVYALAALLNLGIPDSGARYRRCHRTPRALWRNFWRAQARLWGDREGALSMAVTTLFWGSAAVLQFAVLHWAVQSLTLSLDRAAYLQGVVALGIVAGAVAAGRHVALAHAVRVLPLGVLMGLLVPGLAWLHDWRLALPLLAAVGFLGGAMVVPLNALLQHRGQQLLTAGRSIAVQNFNENLSVLVMLGGYAALLAAQWDIRWVMALLGGLVAAATAALAVRHARL